MKSQITSRTTILGVLLVMCGLLFAARLFYLQVIKHDYYVAQAVAEHQKKFTLPAKRGLIYARDRSGLVPLVMNEPVFTLYADPRYVRDPKETAEAIARIVGGSIANYEEKLGQKELAYVVVARKINKTQADQIKKAQLYGVGLKEAEQRVYPEGPLASQILGFVNDEGQGQYGIEQNLNGRLQGEDGLLRAVTDVHGIPLSISTDNVLKPPRNGDNLVLTVDRNIQAFAEQALKEGLDKAKATKGSALVMDPLSGEILAMANYPTYDPTKIGEISDYSQLLNNTVNYPYEVGSVMKVLTMAAGINEGAVNKDSTYVNKDFVQVDDARINNVLKMAGVLNMQQVLAYSLNTGVVHVLEQLGGGQITYEARQKLYQYFTDHYKLGQPTGIEQEFESQGQIFSPDAEQGNKVRYANMTFGQGMTITMLQMAGAFSSVINGGSYFAPHLVAGKIDENGKMVPQDLQPVKRDVVSADTSAQIREMIIKSMRDTASLDKADRPGYNIGGKTGTSQNIDPKTGKYSDDISDTVGTFIGFGGNEQPKYVIMVRVDDSKIGGYSGSAAAAPIFAEISNWLIDYYRIPPLR